MTKGERRRLRKQARAAGLPLAGELALGRGDTRAHSPTYPPPTGTAEAMAYMHQFMAAHPQPPSRTFIYYEERALDRGDGQCEFSETPKGRIALERWAENYEKCNGAPDSPEDV